MVVRLCARTGGDTGATKLGDLPSNEILTLPDRATVFAFRSDVKGFFDQAGGVPIVPPASGGPTLAGTSAC